MLSNHNIPRSAFQVSKTIYAKKKSNDFKEKDFIKIIQNEVAYHIGRYPDLKFKGISKPIHNADRSATYQILFELKEE